MSLDSGRFAYPVFLDLRDRLVVVVGAGSVGRRKLAGLLRGGARVRLVDPCLAGQPEMADGVEYCARAFAPDDLRGALLVFACTDSAQVNQAVVAAARELGALCCRADLGEAGDFALPALLEKGDLRVAVSTSGGSPALAAAFRDRLAEAVPDTWGFALELAAALRRKWLTEQIGDKYNQQVLRDFLCNRLLPLCEAGKLSEIDRLLIDVCGEDFSLERLGLLPPEGIL